MYGFIGTVGLFLCVLPLSLCAQQLSADDRKIIQEAQQHYYSLPDAGLVAFSCNVAYDLNSLPETILPETAVRDREILSHSTFQIHVADGKPNIIFSLPEDTDEPTKTELQTASGLMKQTVGGFIGTWPSKGWSGPIPPFTNWASGVERLPTGYIIRASGSTNGLVQIELNHALDVMRVVSVQGTVIEQPQYQSTPHGLVYSGLKGEQTSPQGNTHIVMKIDSSETDGFLLPQDIHVDVNDNLKVHFSFTQCTVRKADAVIHLKP